MHQGDNYFSLNSGIPLPVQVTTPFPNPFPKFEIRHKTIELTLPGPNNSWTLHGLWPDHCDGTYDANCDASREYSNITAILSSYGKTDLLSYMSTFWKDYQGNDESFWEHEWDKHGTCISTLEPTCYGSYKGQEEVVDYFEIAVELFKGLDSYSVCCASPITPINII